MENSKNSKEVIYSVHNIKSYLTGVKKIYPKRKSDDVTDSKLCLYKSNSNSDTNDTNNNKYTPNPQPEKKICIKFKDLVADKEEKNDEINMELALSLKKRRYTKEQKKMYKCNNKINLGNDKEETNGKKLKKNKSVGKLIIEDKDDNSMLKKLKKKILCCFS